MYDSRNLAELTHCVFGRVPTRATGALATLTVTI